MLILTKSLQTDPERVVGHFLLVSKNWNRLVKSKDFASQYNHENCPKGRRRIIIQTSRVLGEDGKMWDLILEEGRPTILIERCTLPLGREMIGANGTYVAFGNTFNQNLLLLRDWVSWDLHPVGMTRGPSRCLAYGYERVLRVFDEGDAKLYELKNASQDEDGAWSPSSLLNRQIGIVSRPCSTTHYFCFLLTPHKDTPIMIRINRLSGQLFEDETPRCAHLCALHVIERRDKIHLCRLSNSDGLETFVWNDNNRSWLLFSRYDMVIGGDPKVNWRVFGAGQDWVLISCCNIIYVVNVATNTLVHSQMLPVYGNSVVIADYIDGCRCASLKTFARKRHTLTPL